MEWNISVVLFCTLFWMVYECIIIANANAVLTIFQLLCTYYHIYSSSYDMGPTLNSFSKWRDWVTKRKFLFQRIKVVNSNAKTDVQAVSRPVLLIYCTILPSHCNRFSHSLNLSFLVTILLLILILKVTFGQGVLNDWWQVHVDYSMKTKTSKEAFWWIFSVWRLKQNQLLFAALAHNNPLTQILILIWCNESAGKNRSCSVNYRWKYFKPTFNYIL